jgi:hypothetical protein
VPPIGLEQAVIFFEKKLKKAAISPKPLWQALYVQKYQSLACVLLGFVPRWCSI